MQLVNAQLGQGKFDAAKQSIEKFGKANPGSPIYLRGRAMVLMMAGPVDSAKRAFLEMGLQVHSPEYQNYTHGGLAAIALQHGRLTEAFGRVVAGQSNPVRGHEIAALRRRDRRHEGLAAHQWFLEVLTETLSLL